MLWQEAARGGKADKFKSSMNSDDYTVIPAFTVFEIEMSCKGWSQWEAGDVNENAKNKPRYIPTFIVTVHRRKPRTRLKYDFLQGGLPSQEGVRYGDLYHEANATQSLLVPGRIEVDPLCLCSRVY
jgi:hypothetical protein